MSAIITPEKLESALEYLAGTDHDYALEKAQLERSEILRKRIRAKLFLTSDGTVAERQAKAEVAAETEQVDDDYCKTVAAFEMLRAKRQRAEIVVDVWRSLEASRRKA
jgi:hypothetical protein